MKDCKQCYGETIDYYAAVQDVDYECKENYFDNKPENLIKRADLKSSVDSSFG